MKHYGEKRDRITGLLIGLLVLISADVWLFSDMGYRVARLFAVLFLLLGMVLHLENVFYLYIFCFPFSGLLKFSNAGISILPILNIIIILRLLWRRVVKISHLQILAFLGLLLLQMLCVLFYNANITKVGSFFVSLLFVICGAAYFMKQQERTDIFIYASVFYVAAIIASVVLSDLFPRAMYLIAPEKQMVLDFGGRFGATFVEPNEFAQAVLVGIGLLIAIFPMLRKVSHKAVALVAIVYLGISGYRSVSKSYVLTLMGMFVVLILMNWYRTGKYKGLGNAVLKIVPSAIILVVGVWLILEKVVFPTMEARTSVDLLTGRDDLWVRYTSALMQRVDILFWGSGAGNTTKLADTVESIGNIATHNTYLEYLIQFGVFGLFLLICVVAKPIKENTYKLSTYFVLTLAAYCATALGISANDNDCIFLVVLLMTMPSQKRRDISTEILYLTKRGIGK